MPNNQSDTQHEHFNGICKKEFNRGYAFGRRESYDELLRTPGAKARTVFESDHVLISIPREEYQKLQDEVERNL